jgi:hypothetical protein
MANKAKTTPRKPSLFNTRGQAFYDYATADFDLTESEQQILFEVCRTLDELADLAQVIERDGVTVTGSTGQTRTHPALNDVRQHRLALGRLISLLELPDLDGETLPTFQQAQARNAGRKGAQKRWNG